MASNANVLTNEDIAREMNRIAESHTAPNLNQPPPLPTVKIGGQDVAFDPAAIQDALTRYETGTKTQLSEFKDQLERLQERTVDVNTEQPRTLQQPQPQVVAPPPTPGKRKTAKEWADEFVEDPTSTIAQTLGDLVGAPGQNGAEVIKNALLALHQNQQRLSLENQALLESQKQLDQRISESQAVSSAKGFLDRHPEYEANDDNTKAMRAYLEQYRLNPTEDNLDLVYAKAVADGRVKVKAQEQEQTQQQFNGGFNAPPPQQRQSGMPSLRGGQSNFTPDDQFLINQADKMSTQDLGQLIERLKSGSFSR